MAGPVKKIITLLLASLVIALASTPARADQARKIKTQVQPVVSELAKHMNLKGSVRIEVEIASDGTVKATKVLGGHPLLIQCSEEAVRKWKYEPGSPTKTIVQFNFR